MGMGSHSAVASCSSSSVPPCPRVWNPSACLSPCDSGMSLDNAVGGRQDHQETSVSSLGQGRSRSRDLN